MTTSVHCANCGTNLVGEYCHACGQHRLQNAELSLLPVVRQFADELLHLDFKSLRTLFALFAPGLLTAEFLAGHRRAYLSPLKVYFLAAAVFFFAAPFVGFSLPEMIARDERGVLTALVRDAQQQRAMSSELFQERFDVRVQTVYTIALSISVIVTAVLLKGLFRGRTLGAHLVCALHYVSFLYIAAVGMSAVQKLAAFKGATMSLALTYAILIPYLFVALRRVYAESALRTLTKVAVLCAITFVVDGVVNIGAFMVTLWFV